MEFAKILLNNNVEVEVKGLFYIYNSCYYFLYTEKELDEKGYVILKLVQVGKEVKNTESGTVETGYMIGIEPSDWESAKQSITMIVNDKKNSTQSSEIKYLPINMLATLKISGNKTIKLMKNIVEQYFNVEFEEGDSTPTEANMVPQTSEENLSISSETSSADINSTIVPTPPIEVTAKADVVPQMSEDNSQISNETTAGEIDQTVVSAPSVENSQETNNLVSTSIEQPVDTSTSTSVDSSTLMSEDTDVIIDYRKSFFEEQEKNKQLEARIQELMEKLNQIKEILE